ncbi:ABC transporter substrate binding protein [Bosea vestrisii]|uniref:ABC transporter substrate binding protein n=1 Tax=Bosea vestrisii TaxID=151416 RepID=UPI003D767B1B
MPCSLRQAVPTTRREIIALLGAMAASTVSARAQQKTTPVIGYLGSESPEPYGSRLAAFVEGLAEAGYVDGRNVTIDFRWAEGQYSRLPALAMDLADRQVTVMVAPGGAEVALAARSATKTIPIVFELGAIRSRWAWSPACPGQAAISPA